MNRALVLGLDGATFSVLDPLMEAGLMPALKGLCQTGTRAELLSTPNPLTPSAWTSMTTGRSPGNHGVFDFVRVERSGRHPNFRLATSSDIQCPTIWSMLGERGLTTISLNFPVMFPPKAQNGFMIPGFVPHRHLRLATHPRSFYDRLGSIPGLKLDEITVDFEEERRSVQVLEPGEYEEWIRFHIRREKHWWRILHHLMETEPWDLSAVVFDGVDKLQHSCWRFLDESLFDPAAASQREHRIRQLCLDYFRQLDELIARLLELTDDRDSVFVVSDHGFGPTQEIFYVNTWLSRQGHLVWHEDAPFAKEGMLNTEGMKTPAFLFDWDRTQAFALTPGSNGIYFYLKGRADDPSARSEEREKLARELTEALLAVVNPATGQRVVKKVLRREEAFAGTASDLAPDLTLVLADYGFVSVLRSDEVVKSRTEIVGAHRPNGVFVAAGPGIRKGREIDRLSILDVTPLLMYSLDEPIPDTFEGRLPEELFEHDRLEAQPARAARLENGSDWLPSGPGEGPTMDADGERAIMERLRALGYLE